MECSISPTEAAVCPQLLEEGLALFGRILETALLAECVEEATEAEAGDAHECGELDDHRA